ncbi:MAG: hypothetical protein KDK50_06620 [Chlamydiia bacterium]|nr:hypothetical protein [Chlamydiia bacterium]
MSALDNVSREQYFDLQGSPHETYRERQEKVLGSKIVCSKTLAISKVRNCVDAHIWTLNGSRVVNTVNVCNYEPGTLRVECNIRPSFITDNFEHFKKVVLPQFGQFQDSFCFSQINSGVPKPVKVIQANAEALLNMVCRVEGLKSSSLRFMLEQFINEVVTSEDITIAVTESKI